MGEGRRGVNRGDVRAQFEAFESAGAVIFFRGLFSGSGISAVGAPPANVFEHSIRPFSLWDGRHFCETDWHLLVIAIIRGALEGEPQITRDEGEAFLEPRSVDLNLDGERLTDTERTSIRPLIRSLTVDDDGTLRVISSGGWWFQTGAFFGPGQLAVGPHTFSATITGPAGIFEEGPITFHIDAAGTGSCL